MNRGLKLFTVYLDGNPVGQATCNLKPSEREGEARIYGMLMGVLEVRRSQCRATTLS